MKSRLLRVEKFQKLKLIIFVDELFLQIVYLPLLIHDLTVDPEQYNFKLK